MIHFLKFLHVLIALSLLGSTFYCIAFARPKSAYTIRINNILLLFVFLALLTGTLLIYPKHFTFQTPWIMAAYLLLLVFSSGLLLLNKIKFKIQSVNKLIYIFLFFVLILITHDAVTKTTFLFKFFTVD